MHIAFVILTALFGFFSLDVSPQNIETASLTEQYRVCTLENDEKRAIGVCLRELADSAYKAYTTAEIEGSLSLLTNTEKSQWCHEFMHYLGWELFEDTQSIADSFTKASGLCDSGMFHGAVEEYISENGLSVDVEGATRQLADEACEALHGPDVTYGLRGICYHGLGHGLMFLTGNDLPASLSLCDETNEQFTTSCYTGVFMENTLSKQIGLNADHESAFAYNDDPDFPCSILEDRHKDYCYFYRGSNLILENFGAYGPELFRGCLAVAGEYQHSCFRGIGANIPNPGTEAEVAAQRCEYALNVGPEAYEQCISGGLPSLIQIKLGDANAAVKYCDAVEEGYKDMCYQNAGMSLRGWTTEEHTLKEKCRSFRDAHAFELCMTLKTE